MYRISTAGLASGGGNLLGNRQHEPASSAWPGILLAHRKGRSPLPFRTAAAEQAARPQKSIVAKCLCAVMIFAAAVIAPSLAAPASAATLFTGSIASFADGPATGPLALNASTSEASQSAYQDEPMLSLTANTANGEGGGITDDTQSPDKEAGAPTGQALVREIQTLLGQRGFNAGPADGIMGPTTARAISDFQRSAGIPVDGRPSGDLLARLRESGQEQPADQPVGSPKAAHQADKDADKDSETEQEPPPPTARQPSLVGTKWRIIDETGSTIVLEFAANGLIKGTLYERFWSWHEAAGDVGIFYDNGMGLSVTRTGRLSTDYLMSGQAKPSRGEEWSWSAERISPPPPPETDTGQTEPVAQEQTQPIAEGKAAPEAEEETQPIAEGKAAPEAEEETQPVAEEKAEPEPEAAEETQPVTGTPEPPPAQQQTDLVEADSGNIDRNETADQTTAPSGDTTDTPPQPPQTDNEAAAGDETPAPPPVVSETAPEPSAAVAPPVPEESAASAPPPESAAPPENVKEAERPPRVYGENETDSRIVIQAVDDSWLEVTDAEGKIIFSRVLRKGDSYRAPSLQGARFVTGNAGGLEILVDGEPVPGVGPSAKVRRDIQLDPDLLKAGTAWTPPQRTDTDGSGQ